MPICDTFLTIALSDVVCIRDLQDPQRRYAGLSHLRDCRVECPDVRDGNGLIIHPRDYITKLADACFVELEVYIKLSVVARHQYLTRAYLQSLGGVFRRNRKLIQNERSRQIRRLQTNRRCVMSLHPATADK